MAKLQVKDPLFKEKVIESFERQKAMQTLGISIKSVEAGEVTLSMAHSDALTQQHGFIHGGIVSTILDSACGYAAFTLMPADTAILSIEFKVNLLSPAKGEQFVAIGKVKKAGKTISVCEGELFAMPVNDSEQNTAPKLVATMSCTLMAIANRENLNN